MRQSITAYQFRDDLHSQFTYEGCQALFEFLEEREMDTGVEYNYDPIAYKVEFTEYANIEEVREVYPSILDSVNDEDVYSTLWEYTDVIPVLDVDGQSHAGLILRDF